MKITDIKEQEKNKNKLSIFVDDAYFDAILKEVFLKSSLKVGSEITEEIWQELKAEHETRYAFNKGLFYLKSRDRAEKEMRDYLAKKGFHEEAIEGAIEKLKSYSYIDDVRFAKAWVADGINIKRKGRKAIVYDLRRLGIDDQIIEEALMAYDDTMQQDNAIVYAKSLAKRHVRVADPYKKRQKMTAALARRGYDWEIIKQAIEHVLGLEEEV